MLATRRLAAILAADMVGYSRFMASNEHETLKRLDAARRAVVLPVIDEHGGRVVKEMGDGFLAEFASAVDAVACGMRLQQELAIHNTETCGVEACGLEPLQFRVGINVGDIVADRGDIFGDGVNVAARIESAAPVGGVAIPERVYQDVHDKLNATFDDLGEHTLKNIPNPLRLYNARPDSYCPLPGTVPDKQGGGDDNRRVVEPLSIAVLPFTNMSSDPEQAYLADGLTEDIITALSKVRTLSVIARNSTFVYKGQSVDIKGVAAELSVRYVLEGSVRRAGDTVRTTAQLIDGATGAHVWAERYDGTIDDIFALQDQITETVVAAIEPQLLAAEGRRVRRRPTESLAAWQLVTRSLGHFWLFTAVHMKKAARLAQKAADADPDYGHAHAVLALVQITRAWLAWEPTSELPTLLDSANAAARRATSLDGQDAWGHLALGIVLAFQRQHEPAIAELRTAIRLNPSFAMAHGWLSLVLGYSGQPDEGLSTVDRALGLSPNDPFAALYDTCKAINHFARGEYTEMVVACRAGLRERPEHVGAHRMLTVALAYLGRDEEAAAAFADTKRLQPDISLDWACAYAPFADLQDLNRYVDGLRRAGMG